MPAIMNSTSSGWAPTASATLESAMMLCLRRKKAPAPMGFAYAMQPASWCAAETTGQRQIAEATNRGTRGQPHGGPLQRTSDLGQFAHWSVTDSESVGDALAACRSFCRKPTSTRSSEQRFTLLARPNCRAAAWQDVSLAHIRSGLQRRLPRSRAAKC